jgi:glycerol kinase
MKKACVLVLDQGTTNLKAFVFDAQGHTIATASQQAPQIFPKPGWVEQDPKLIVQAVRKISRDAMQMAEAHNFEICALGVTNQTESIVLWEKASGKPVYNVITWQCMRTAEYCRRLADQKLGEMIQSRTGLPLNPAFSASKIRWIFENIPGVYAQAKQGKILAGSLDTWMVWHLSERKLHITDVSNASRTMLFNIKTRTWDDELLEIFDIPRQILPTVCSSSEIYGPCHTTATDTKIPICAMIGDQQASLFGQGCLTQGDIKVTYGTGAFLYMNIGRQPVLSDNGLVTTVAWEREDTLTYALEGFIQTAGAVVQWLRDGLQIIKNTEASEKLAAEVTDCGGVYFVPALTGLGAPFWDSAARGTIIGITPGTSRAHITRAALEGICFQVRDAVDAMRNDMQIPFTWMRADGAASGNNLLMQMQADILGLEIKRFGLLEATALGTAKLAGLAAGIWEENEWKDNSLYFDKIFEPAMDDQTREAKYTKWQSALSRARRWAQED